MELNFMRAGLGMMIGARSENVKKAKWIQALEEASRRKAVADRASLAYLHFPKAARVAQLDRVTASEAAGCGFNSRHAHHFLQSFSFGVLAQIQAPRLRAGSERMK